MTRSTGARPRFPARLEPQPPVPAPRGGPLLRPQAHLRQAHADAAPEVQRPGVGLVSADVRGRMAERLRDAAGIRDGRVLDAMRAVERHRFVDPALAVQAYEDTSLPIGHGQTISKPSVVARMIELLLQGAAARDDGSLGRTLEIGTGCGYQAAVLCRLATDVYSIERIRALHDVARINLDGQRPRNLRLVHGDGMLGHAPNAPYRSIVAAAGGDHLPQAWLDQLAVGGRLVAPVSQPGTGGQALVVIDRTEGGFTRSRLEGVLFVPLKSGAV